MRLLYFEYEYYMEYINVSIGMQCTTAYYLRDTNKRKYSFPFDWIVSHPSFVYDMLYLLLDKNLPIDILVNEYFYAVDNMVYVPPVPAEHYRTYNHEDILQYIAHGNVCIYNFNSKYNVVFPHEENNKDANTQKYIRRFERLKEFIFNKNIHINLYYVSQSSNNLGNYTLDGNIIINNVPSYLLKICEIIKKYHGDFFTLYIYDALYDDITPLSAYMESNHIKYIKLNPGNLFCELLTQMVELDNLNKL